MTKRKQLKHLEGDEASIKQMMTKAVKLGGWTKDMIGYKEAGSYIRFKKAHAMKKARELYKKRLPGIHYAGGVRLHYHYRS